MNLEEIDAIVLGWSENPDSSPEHAKLLVERYNTERDGFHQIEAELAKSRERLASLERSLVVQEGAANVLANILREIATKAKTENSP